MLCDINRNISSDKKTDRDFYVGPVRKHHVPRKFGVIHFLDFVPFRNRVISADAKSVISASRLCHGMQYSQLFSKLTVM